jgi:hypothetical protein
MRGPARADPLVRTGNDLCGPTCLDALPWRIAEEPKKRRYQTDPRRAGVARHTTTQAEEDLHGTRRSVLGGRDVPAAGIAMRRVFLPTAQPRQSPEHGAARYPNCAYELTWCC